MSKEYYCYVLMDPRKPGPFVYEGIEFEYEPFYVGKGKGERVFNHAKEARQDTGAGNRHKLNKIRKIWSSGNKVRVRLSDNRGTEKQALRMEQKLIAAIGRHELGTGPLTNLTAGGESGIQGPKVRQRIAQSVSAEWKARSDEDKRLHAKKAGEHSKHAWNTASATHRAMRVQAAKRGIANMSESAKRLASQRKSVAVKAARALYDEEARIAAFHKTMSAAGKREQQAVNIAKGHARRTDKQRAATAVKMAAAWEKRKPMECPHCDAESINYANMLRWHFDNCKHKKRRSK